jgi:hypothetical protein
MIMQIVLSCDCTCIHIIRICSTRHQQASTQPPFSSFPGHLVPLHHVEWSLWRLGCYLQGCQEKMTMLCQRYLQGESFYALYLRALGEHVLKDIWQGFNTRASLMNGENIVVVSEPAHGCDKSPRITPIPPEPLKKPTNFRSIDLNLWAAGKFLPR